MDEKQRLEIAERIRELRERSPLTQPQIAERLHLTLRGYQKLEQRGTTKYERAQELADIHGVDPDWIWDGREKGPTPDPFAPREMVEFLATPVDELRREIERLGELIEQRSEGSEAIRRILTSMEAMNKAGEVLGVAEADRYLVVRRADLDRLLSVLSEQPEDAEPSLAEDAALSAEAAREAEREAPRRQRPRRAAGDR